MADIAYNGSGCFHFNLDPENELDSTEKKLTGVLVPITAEYSSSTAVGATRMIFQLKSPEAYTDIRENPKQIKPEILLFLRRLRRIKIKTEDRNIDYAYLLNDNDIDFDDGETRTLTALAHSKDTTNVTKYIIDRHVVDKMSSEARRDLLVGDCLDSYPQTMHGLHPPVLVFNLLVPWRTKIRIVLVSSENWNSSTLTPPEFATEF